MANLKTIPRRIYPLSTSKKPRNYTTFLHSITIYKVKASKESVFGLKRKMISQLESQSLHFWAESRKIVYRLANRKFWKTPAKISLEFNSLNWGIALPKFPRKGREVSYSINLKTSLTILTYQWEKIPDHSNKLMKIKSQREQAIIWRNSWMTIWNLFVLQRIQSMAIQLITTTCEIKAKSNQVRSSILKPPTQPKTSS